MEEAARYAGGMDRLAISPQCGFASVMLGNDTNEERKARYDSLELPSVVFMAADGTVLRVGDPAKAVIEIEDYLYATSQLAQTTLRSVLGQHELDDLLMERDKLNKDIQEILDKQTDPWGIKVANVEIKHVDLDETMIRAMARQAEAERERRAKVIAAEGEFQASQKLSEAADVMARSPMALQLRYLQTLLEIGATNATTIVFPAPIDMLTAFMGKATGGGDATG